MKTKRFKIIPIVLLMVFFSQQISWACGYNLSLLVNPPPSPLIYQDHGEFNLWVAKRVYSLTKPSFRHNPKDLKSAYQWLKTPATETVPCSAYVLYNLLQAKGIKPKIEDISASLISLDLKAGNLKPPFTASRIDNSLYAMAKTAEAQGLELYPSRLNSLNSQTPKLLNAQTPFIAHLSYGGQSGHFVLVTKIDPEKVYFFYDKGDTFLPYEKFLEEFSGYCLLSFISVTTIPDAESKTILGAGRSYHGRSVNISGVFKKPSSIESVIGIASSIGGAFFPTGGNLWATAAGAGIQVGGGLLFKDSMWGRIATGVAAGAVSGGLSGNTFHGALGLSWGWGTAGIGAAKGLGMSGTIEGIKAMNFGDASLRASIANLLAIPVGQAIEGGLSAKFEVPINGMDKYQANGVKGSFWKGAWVGATFQGSLTNKAEGWKRWAPAIAYYGGQSASIAVEAFGPKKYSSLYSTGISTAFNALTNVAAMGQDDKLWKVLGKSVADGALRGGLSIGLQKLTKDMRVTEGAFLEMAGASLISAGVESAFGKWSGESAVSRKGIFWDNLQKSWKGAMQDVVTFGAAKGYMLGTSGSYAFLKMHELGSNVGKARASGLSAFDSAHWAFNQHVGSTYHNAAVNTLSNTVWNRVSNVKYVYGVGGKGTKFIAEATQWELNKALSKNNAPVSSVLAISAQNVEKGVASSLEQEIKEGLKSNPNSLELQAAQFALINEDVEHASNALKKYQVAEIDQKLGDQSNAGVFGSGSLSPQDTGFINTYGESVWRDQMNQQKVKLSQDISSLTAKIAARLPLIQTLTSNNKPKQLQDSEALTKKPWEIINHNRDTVFRMRHGSINEGQIVKGAPDITSVYNPETGKYEVIVDKKPVDRYEVDRVEDFVVVGNKTLRRVMEMGSTRFPDVEGGLPNAIPGKDMLEFKDNLEKLALALEEKDMLILNSDPGLTQGQKIHQSQHARGNFPLFPGYQLKPGATESEEIPGYDKLIKGRMIYSGDPESDAQPIMSKQREDGVLELGFVGNKSNVSDVFKQDGVEVKDGKFTISQNLSPIMKDGKPQEIAVDKIKWNENRTQPNLTQGEKSWSLGARAAESLPDGRTTYTEAVVKAGETGKSWEEKTTTVLDASIYNNGTGYGMKAEGDKLKVKGNKDDSNYIEVDKIIGFFGDYRAEKGDLVMEYKPTHGDLIEFNSDELKVSRGSGKTHTDVIEGVDGLDLESLKYINDNMIIIQDDKKSKVYFKDDSTGRLGVEAPSTLYANKEADLESVTAVYKVNEDKKLQPYISIGFKDGTTNIYPVADFKGLIPQATTQGSPELYKANVTISSQTPVGTATLEPTPTQTTPAASPTPEPTAIVSSTAQQQPIPAPVPTANWEYHRGDDGKIDGLTIDLSGKKFDIPVLLTEAKDVKIREVNKDVVKGLKEEPKVYITFKDEYNDVFLLTFDPDAGNIVKKEVISYDKSGKERERVIDENKILPYSKVKVVTRQIIDGKGTLKYANDHTTIDFSYKDVLTERGYYVPYGEFIDKNKRRDAAATPAQNVAPTQTTPADNLTQESTATRGDYLDALAGLQNTVGMTFDEMTNFIETSKDAKNMQNYLLKMAERLPILKVEKNGTKYYKIDTENRKYFKDLPQEFKSIEFPSKELAKEARYLYVGDDRAFKANKFKDSWDKFRVAKEALFKYYNKAGNN